MLWLNERSFAALGRITATFKPAPDFGAVPAGSVAAPVDVAGAATVVADGAAVVAVGATVAEGDAFLSDPQDATSKPIAAKATIDRRRPGAWMSSWLLLML